MENSLQNQSHRWCALQGVGTRGLDAAAMRSSPATPTVTDNDAGAPVTILDAAHAVPGSAGPGILAGFL